MGYLEERASLKGRVAAVIGGAAGVGGAVTAALAKAGVDLAICDVRGPELDAAADQVAALGRTVVSQVTDVWEPDQLASFYDAVDNRFEYIDVLVNVVGGGVRSRPFDETSAARWAVDIHRNLGWAMQSTSLALPRLRASGRGGSIINFTTIEAFRACPQVAPYAAAKAALTSFTRSLAAELGHERIRVNAIAPDATPGASRGTTLAPEVLAATGYDRPDLVARSHATYIPLGSAPPADALGDAVLFLASDLSSSITGTTLHVDGGTWAAAGMLHWPGPRGWAPTPPPILFRHEETFG